MDARTWFQSLVLSVQKLGYSQVLYALKPNKEAQNSTAQIMSNFPESWRSLYDNENYSSIDPVVSHSFSSSLPILWEDKLYKTKREREFAEEARRAGLSQGLTLPIHGAQGQVGMLSLSCESMPQNEYSQVLQHSIPAASMLRDYAVTSGSNFFLQNSNSNTPHLTPRELEILHWAWAEKTTWEIGKILSLAEPTVEFHFKNIRRKLNVSSRRLAVARAIQLDLMTP
ncbi:MULTISPECIES: helix-turn-helix transcriptional regulator [Pseudomonas]|nr:MULTISPECIES: LuxR family transcriptional regulator [Pseudomonas]